MKRIVLALLLAVSAHQAHAAATNLATRIHRVTVYADRARVHRTGAATLPAGVTEWAVRGLPGWVDDESVRAALRPAAAGRIVDVRVERNYLAHSADEEVRKAETAVRELDDQMAVLRDEQRILDIREKQIADIRIFSSDKLPKEIATGQATAIDTYAKAVDFVTEGARDLATKKREIALKTRELKPELEARQKRLQEVRQRQQLEQSTIFVCVEATAAGAGTLDVDYMTPGAVWVPVHELRAAGPAADQVTLTSYAIVSQTSGEDWSGSEISFSTQSADAVMRAPELTALRLDMPAVPVPLVGDSSFRRASGKFAAGNTCYNVAVNGAGFDYNDNLDKQNELQNRALTLFTELQQKRGTTAHFTGHGLPQIRSDGRQVRVRIGEATLPARPRIVAAPELSLSASHTVELENKGHQPLLPGRVTLFREGAFLGTTDIGFVAEGETFPAMMGIADQIKLARTLDRRRSALTWSGDRKRMQVAFDLSAENLGSTPALVRLMDRIPVSDNKEIRVSAVDIQPEGKPDTKGLLTWDLTLAPREKRSFRIAYTLEYPANVATQTAAPAARGQQRFDAQGLPAAPAMDMQIQALESKF